MSWNKSSGDKEAYVKQSRAATGKFQISLNKGDKVTVKGESNGWSMVVLQHKGEVIKGIFPTEFLQAQAPEKKEFKPLDPTDNSQEVVLNNEIIQVIREWGTELAKLKVEKRRSEYLEVKQQMAVLVGLRKKINDPKFKDQDPKAKREDFDKILRIIEEGSRKLNLDLIVRVEKGDNRGQRATEKNTPVISLYQLYRNIQQKEDLARNKVKAREGQKGNDKVLETLKNPNLSEKERNQELRLFYDLPETPQVQLLLDVKACIFTVGENTELYFSLYCAETEQFITEDYMVEITPNGMPFDKRFLEYPMQTIFRDIPENYYMKMKGLYLVCRIYRRGKLQLELDKIGTRTMTKQKEEDKLRRPFAVSVLDLTPPVISSHLFTESRYSPKLLPIYTHPDIDLVFPGLHELIIKQNKDIQQVPDKIAIGFALAVQMSAGSFESMIEKEENKGLIDKISVNVPLQYSDDTSDAIRNDLYITLEDGVFPVPNITINVHVYVKSNEAKKCLSRYSTRFTEPSASYDSAVICSNKPSWNERLKINLTPEELSEATVVLIVNQVKKDKPEPFGIAFLPLKDGKMLRTDKKNELTVFKYIKDIEKSIKDYLDNFKRLVDTKAVLFVSTKLVSSQVTHIEKLYPIIKWKETTENLGTVLQGLKYFNIIENPQYFRIVMEALFGIIQEKKDNADTAYTALCDTLDAFSKRQYTKIRSSIESYLEKNFVAPKLWSSLTPFITKYLVDDKNNVKTVGTTLRCLNFLVLAVIVSRVQYLKENKPDDFNKDFLKIFKNLNVLIGLESNTLLAAQDASLKLIPSLFTYLPLIFSDKEVSEIIIDFINAIPKTSGRKNLIEGKLFLLGTLGKSKVIENFETRKALLPVFIEQLKLHINMTTTERRLSVEILSNLLMVCQDFTKNNENEIKESKLMISQILPSLILAFKENEKEKKQLMSQVSTTKEHDEQLMLSEDILKIQLIGSDITSCLLCLFYQTDSKTLDGYFTSSPKTNVLEILEIIRIFIANSPIPEFWISFNVFQYYVIVDFFKALSGYLSEGFLKGDSFDFELWNTFFNTVILFIQAPRLRLEEFSTSKQNKLISQHGDLRVEALKCFTKSWELLGDNQANFISNLVAPILRVANIPKPDIYLAALNIYFGILKREFKQTQSLKETEKITAVILDEFISNQILDDRFKDFFIKTLEERFKEDQEMYIEGTRFLNKINQMIRLISAVLKYRDEDEDEKTSALRKVMKYFQSTKSDELYIKYVYSLARVQAFNKNHVEAAISLQQQIDLLSFSSTNKLPAIENAGIKEYPEEEEKERKEKLLLKCIDYFDQGRDWERGIKLCNELVDYYQKITFNYAKLSGILKKQGEFYEKIAKTKRFYSSYFYVGFHGKGFKGFDFKDKRYIYKGAEAERLADFITRIHKRFPNAEIIKTSDPPSKEILEGNSQYLQIFTVYSSCQRDIDTNCTLPKLNQNMPNNIASYDEFNNLNIFKFSKTFRMTKDKSFSEYRDMCTQFTFLMLDKQKSFPNLVRKLRVKSTHDLLMSPVQNAVKNIEDKVIEFQQLIISHRLDPVPDTNKLSMQLNGVIDAAVMGGVQKYVDAFFVPEFLKTNANEIENLKRFQRALDEQIIYLRLGLDCYKQFGSVKTRPHAEHLENMFIKMKDQLQNSLIKFDFSPYEKKE